MTPIAIALVHGIEIQDENFASTAIEKLKRCFARELRDVPDCDPEAALCIDVVHWAPVVEPRQKKLLEKLYPASHDKLFSMLKQAALSLNRGSTSGLLRLVASLSMRYVPGLRGPHWPGARWLAMHFVGDIIAYQPGADRSTYDAVHELFAQTLGRLAAKAGADAPLCVIAHSYGSNIASDFFYDLDRNKRPPPATPLERGHTLSHFYSLGSPIALWSLRYADVNLDSPIRVPAKQLAKHYPGLSGEWINFYDEDDVIAYPLRDISPAYRDAVARDERIRLKVPLVSWSPLVHPFYWSDDRVIATIARSLAQAWTEANRPGARPQGAVRPPKPAPRRRPAQDVTK